MPYQLVRVLRNECSINADLIARKNNDDETIFNICTHVVAEQLKARALKRFKAKDILPALHKALSLIEVLKIHLPI